MSFRDRLSLSLPPHLLRLALGLTFLWAGSAKMLSTTMYPDYTPEQAAVLANAGFQRFIDAAAAPGAGGRPTGEAPADAEQPPEEAADETGTPSEPLPEPDDQPAEESEPTGGDEQADGEGAQGDGPDAQASLPAGARVMLAQNEQGGEQQDPAPQDEQTQEPTQEQDAGQADQPAEEAADDAADQARQPAPAYTADDFAAPVSAKGVYRVYLTMHAKSSTEDGRTPLLPSALTTGQNARYLTLATGWTELFAGILVLIGLLTRLASLSLAVIMGVALWLTSIGDHVVNNVAGGAFFGLLPPLTADHFSAWTTLFLQLSLLCIGLSLFFSRPGRLSIDSLLGYIFTGGKEPRRPRPE